MSCDRHPSAKDYNDKSNGRNRCAGCVKETIAARTLRKKYPLGKATQDILDGLGIDAAPRRYETGIAEHSLHAEDGYGWAEHVNALSIMPCPADTSS